MATSTEEIYTVVQVAVSQLTEITIMKFLWLFSKHELILPTATTAVEKYVSESLTTNWLVQVK